LGNAGVAESGNATDLRSVTRPGLRVRNLEPNSEYPSSSAQKRK